MHRSPRSARASLVTLGTAIDKAPGHRGWLLTAALLSCAACGSPPPPETPAPPLEDSISVEPAPAAVAGVSIYVHFSASPPENGDDCHDYGRTNGYTGNLRTAVALALTKAGYKVAVDRQLPADLTALVQLQWEQVYSEDAPQPQGVGTLALRDQDGRVVDRFSVPLFPVGRGYDAHLDMGRGASELVARMAASEALVQFAASRPKKSGLAVASSAGGPEPADRERQAAAAAPMTFADAVKDAATAGPEEVSTALVPILPSTPGLVWSEKGQKKRVLMVTWTSYKGYDDQVGKSQVLARETWVTPAPFVARFCKGKGADAAALTARLEQLLGLPANNGKDRFVELWVEPKDLFRPCPDPEITDRECELDFPQPSSMVTVSAAHVKWFDDLKSKSYGENGYPWTRLGYTYDWAGPKVGMSEYVIKKGAEIAVERALGTADYCK